MGNKFIFVILANGYHKIMYKISKLILPSIDTLFLMYMASYVAVSVIFSYTILPVGCDTCMHKLIYNYVVLSCLAYGRAVPAAIEQPLDQQQQQHHPGKNTVTFEARLLKSLFLRLLQ